MNYIKYAPLVERVNAYLKELIGLNNVRDPLEGNKVIFPMGHTYLYYGSGRAQA